jgi:hypothetical protein
MTGSCERASTGRERGVSYVGGEKEEEEEEASMRLVNVPELVLSATLLASDGVVAPLLAFSFSFVEGDDLKPRWVSLSSDRTIRQQETRGEMSICIDR